MALPQDGQNANGLTKVTEVPTGKELIFVDPTTNEGGIITLEDLTTQILKNLTSQTFALDQGNMTLLAALNQLNSNRAFVRLFDNGSKSDAVIFTLKPSFVYQDIIFCGSLSSFGTISLMDGDAPRIYTNGKNDGILKVKSATKTSITLEMAGYSRVSFFSYWDFSVSA